MEKKLLDYVIQHFNLSSARLNKPQGLGGSQETRGSSYDKTNEYRGKLTRVLGYRLV